MHDPVDNNEHYRWNAFYFNREDSRMLVPKRNHRVGFTVNFAHPVTWLLAVALLFVLYLMDQIARLAKV